MSAARAGARRTATNPAVSIARTTWLKILKEASPAAVLCSTNLPGRLEHAHQIEPRPCVATVARLPNTDVSSQSIVAAKRQEGMFGVAFPSQI